MNQIGDNGGVAFGETSTLTRLEEITLNDNRIGDKTAIAFANNEHLGNLRHLSFGGNRYIGTKGYTALCTSKHLSRLIRFYYLGALSHSELKRINTDKDTLLKEICQSEV